MLAPDELWSRSQHEAVLITVLCVISHFLFFHPGTMALKRVRFALQEEGCEYCFHTRRQLRQQQRSFDTALRRQT